MSEPPVTAEPPGDVSPPREATDRSPWNWLLILPIVVPLAPALFNMDSPRLFGFPAYYWVQLAFIVLGVATTSVVYRMTRDRAVRS